MKDSESKHVKWELVGGEEGKKSILSHFNYLLGLPIMARICKTLNTPQLSTVCRLFFLSSCTCFLFPAWFYIKTKQHGSTCSFYSTKELNNGGLLIYLLIYILQHLIGLETEALQVYHANHWLRLRH